MNDLVRSILPKVISKGGGRFTSAEYRAWDGMKQRCYNPNTHNYHRYGGRGIIVCDKWKNDFIAFLSDVGPRPSRNHSLGRRNNDLGYSPDNVEWQTLTTQQRNRENSVFLPFKGKNIPAMELAEMMGVDRTAIYHYLKVKKFLEENGNQ